MAPGASGTVTLSSAQTEALKDYVSPGPGEAPSLARVRGDDQELKNLWRDALEAGRFGRRFGRGMPRKFGLTSRLKRHAQLRTNRLGGPYADRLNEMVRVQRAGYELGRLERRHGTRGAALEARAKQYQQDQQKFLAAQGKRLQQDQQKFWAAQQPLGPVRGAALRAGRGLGRIADRLDPASAARAGGAGGAGGEDEGNGVDAPQQSSRRRGGRRSSGGGSRQGSAVGGLARLFGSLLARVVRAVGETMHRFANRGGRGAERPTIVRGSMTEGRPFDRARTDRAQTDRAQTDRARTDRAHPDRARTDRARTDRARPERERRGRSTSSRSDTSAMSERSDSRERSTSRSSAGDRVGLDFQDAFMAAVAALEAPGSNSRNPSPSTSRSTSRSPSANASRDRTVSPVSTRRSRSSSS